MLKKAIENKKILIGLLITLFAVIVIAVYMLAGNDSENSKKTPTSNIEVESEEGLDVVGEDENVPEEESDTSAYWDEGKSNNKQNDKNQNNNATDENASSDTTDSSNKSNGDKTDGNNQSDKNETDDMDKEDKNEEYENGDVSNGEILKDETTWGEIY